MIRYSRQKRMLVAVDCIIFGYDGQELKLLLIRRAFEPEMGKWSLMGGFVQADESSETAAFRVLKQLTGLENVYMEQLYAFSHPDRDPLERTVSVAYFSLIDINQYQQQISHEYHAEWFPIKKIPPLIFDHGSMVTLAKEKLRSKANHHPILFELLAERFTLPQLHNLYEKVYETVIDKRNFSRKILSSGLLVRLKQKEKGFSKRGAYYYRIDKRAYQHKFDAFAFLPPSGK
jgi:ADP-ribose pyrophosphatase YjhB (NUDIX family)